MFIKLKKKYRLTGSAGSSPKSKARWMPPGWHIEAKDVRWTPKDYSKLLDIYVQFGNKGE